MLYSKNRWKNELTCICLVKTCSTVFKTEEGQVCQVDVGETGLDLNTKMLTYNKTKNEFRNKKSVHF